MPKDKLPHDVVESIRYYVQHGERGGAIAYLEDYARSQEIQAEANERDGRVEPASEEYEFAALAREELIKQFGSNTWPRTAREAERKAMQEANARRWHESQRDYHIAAQAYKNAAQEYDWTTYHYYKSARDHLEAARLDRRKGGKKEVEEAKRETSAAKLDLTKAIEENQKAIEMHEAAMNDYAIANRGGYYFEDEWQKLKTDKAFDDSLKNELRKL
jgi:hypothetical protein